MTLHRYPDWLPAEPATDRQVERLKELADELGKNAVTYLQARMAKGVGQNEAWRLIGQFGARAARERRERAAEPERLSL